jgi:hypothetical protein
MVGRWYVHKAQMEMKFASRNVQFYCGNHIINYWLKGQYYHRNNGPSIIYINGHRYWYDNGKLIPREP